MSDNILEVKGLTRHFPTRGGLTRRSRAVVRAVDGVDLGLSSGETLGIVGESGCGKSTLTRLLAALDRPTSGEVLYEGEDVFAMSRREMRRWRRHVQIVLQDPYTSLNPRMTVEEIVGEPFEIHPEVAPKDSRRRRILDLMEMVGLDPDYATRYPYQFSGGQRQRIGIARAIALRPRVLICDEPVSALDVSVQAQVINLLDGLQDELGLSVVFVAHDLSVVRHVSDRVAVMYLGKVVELGRQGEIYEDSSHPYTRALLSVMPVPDPQLRGQREQIILVGDVPSPADPPPGCRFHTRCWKAQELCSVDEPSLIPGPDSSHSQACHFPVDG